MRHIRHGVFFFPISLAVGDEFDCIMKSDRAIVNLRCCIFFIASILRAQRMPWSMYTVLFYVVLLWFYSSIMISCGYDHQIYLFHWNCGNRMTAGLSVIIN